MVLSRSTVGYSNVLAVPFADALSLATLPKDCARPRIPIGRAHELLQRTVAKSGDAAIGLKAGSKASFGDAGALDYAMRSAADLDQALLTLARYIRVINGELSVRIERAARRTRVRLTSISSMPPVVEDFMMSALYTVHLESSTSAHANLVCNFTQRIPVDVSAHERIFSPARICFGAMECGFELDSAALHTPSSTAELKLHELLVSQLERELRELPEAISFSERVGKRLQLQEPLNDTSLKTVADAMSMTPRTLARRLEREGTSFAEIFDQLRRARALRSLDEGEHSVQEIAVALGFSCSSTFHRAFKRWTGQAPREYRRGRRSSATAR